MNISKMYVPNVGKWMKYYQEVAQGKENAYTTDTKRNTKQFGGGLLHNSNEFMIPIDKSDKEGEKSLPSREVNVNMVSPVQQNVEQVKSEIKRKHSPRHRQSAKKRRLVNISHSKKRLQRKVNKVKPVKSKAKVKKSKKRSLISQWLR